MNAIAALPVVDTSGERHFAARQRRIPQLDGLRGIAVLLVVLYHFVPSMVLAGIGLQRSFHFGWCGVDLFFVLSGFLIGGILLDARESPSYFRTFYSRRFYRIFPLYYIWIFFYAVLAAGAFSRLPASIAVAWPGARPLVVYALFLQNVVHKDLSGIVAGAAVVACGGRAVLPDDAAGRAVSAETAAGAVATCNYLACAGRANTGLCVDTFGCGLVCFNTVSCRCLSDGCFIGGRAA